MLYSGHFSFDEIRQDMEPRHGYFTCLVDARNPEQALEKFKKRIYQVKEDEKHSMFADIVAVYVEDLIQISGIPKEAVITRYQSSKGQFPKSESCNLPASDTKKIESYQWIENLQNPIPKDDEYEEAIPFLTFKQQKQADE